MKQRPENKPSLGVPVAHILVYWVPLSLLLWALILVPLFYFLGWV